VPNFVVAHPERVLWRAVTPLSKAKILPTSLPSTLRRTTRDALYYDISRWWRHAAASAFKLVTSIEHLAICIRFFCSCDLDLDSVTLTYECGLDILKMYQKWSFYVKAFKSYSTNGTDRQTHDTHAHTHRLTDATESITIRVHVCICVCIKQSSFGDVVPRPPTELVPLSPQGTSVVLRCITFPVFINTPCKI